MLVMEVYAVYFAAGMKSAENIRCAGLSNPSQVPLRHLAFRGPAFPSILLTGPVDGVATRKRRKPGQNPACIRRCPE